MKKTRFGLILKATLAAVLALCTLCAVSCGQEPSAPSDVTTDDNGTTADVTSENTTAQDTDAPGSGAPKLSSLGLSDGTPLAFSPDVTEYEIALPAGNPRVPTVSATAEEGTDVTVTQAVIAPGKEEAEALVTVSDGNGSTVYKIKMKKSNEKGFVLQYDDRYVFKPAYTLASGEKFTFKSTDTAVLTVAADGTVTAKKVSKTPVNVEALVNGEVKDTLKVDRVDKAALSLFLIVGQSNAWGSHDSGDSTGAAQSDKPSAGVGYYINANDGSVGALTDLSAGRSGFGPALAKRWNELTGEKSLLVHTAISGSPIETWLKGGDKYSSKGNGYDNTLSAYKFVMNRYGSANSNFEIIRTGCFWCQGETGQVREWTGSSWNQSNPKIQGSKDYYDKFMKMYADFKSDMKIDFFSVMLVRALKQTVSAESLKLGLLTDLVPVRAAQYTINATTDDRLIIASRLCDIATKEGDGDKTATGYGYMGPENVHRTQKGYNAEGIELAENTYKLIYSADRAPKSLEVLAPDGRTRLDDGATVKVAKGKDLQLAAIVLPLYNDSPKLSWSVTKGGDLCAVDEFGKVTFGSGAAVGDKAEITVTAECGFTKTITAEITESQAEDVPEPTGNEISLAWTFDDLTEENGYSDLTLSSRSGKGNYSISEGTIKLNDRNTDFVLSQPFVLADNFDWSIEWRGKAVQSSALFGTDYSKNDFIYVAFTTPSWSNPFRMVSSTGTAAMIPYGSYTDKNKEMNSWRVEYSKDTKTMTLYFLGDGSVKETVGSYTWTNSFTFNITNMFGRYGSSSTLVCWNGEMDYIRVLARTK